MGRPAFGFLVALAIAHLRLITAVPAVVTLPALGPASNPSKTYTAVELGVDSSLGYTTYDIQGALLSTIPFTGMEAGSSCGNLFASHGCCRFQPYCLDGFSLSRGLDFRGRRGVRFPE
ncbi:hypothetical protein B0H17DRAFT_1110602 [Mycena rosella]|uniref:Hydrophobin n=1 Tax=Mycena rosella TaxID=1033263 RepID=A0AAD7BNZ7_MYCRO|nr:hypothetical protein B0H17DRAFT_1110602 [Mycena rosella]